MNNNVYTKKVVVGPIGSVDAYIYRNGKEVISEIFQNWRNPWADKTVQAKSNLKRGHKWADEMIIVLQAHESTIDENGDV